MKAAMKTKKNLRGHHPVKKKFQDETDEFDGDSYSRIEFNEELESHR